MWGWILAGWAGAVGVILLFIRGATMHGKRWEELREQERAVIGSLVGVHGDLQCAGTTCVIHKPSDGPHRWMPLHWRNDRGIFERICSHGVGHPDPDQFEYWSIIGMGVNSVHGCDGCCMDLQEDPYD